MNGTWKMLPKPLSPVPSNYVNICPCIMPLSTFHCNASSKPIDFFPCCCFQKAFAKTQPAPWLGNFFQSSGSVYSVSFIVVPTFSFHLPAPFLPQRLPLPQLQAHSLPLLPLLRRQPGVQGHCDACLLCSRGSGACFLRFSHRSLQGRAFSQRRGLRSLGIR